MFFCASSIFANLEIILLKVLLVFSNQDSNFLSTLSDILSKLFSNFLSDFSIKFCKFFIKLISVFLLSFIISEKFLLKLLFIQDFKS